MKIHWQHWAQINELNSNEFVCGFCGNQVGSNKGYYTSHVEARIYVCPTCGSPTFFFEGRQIPGPLLGRNINHLPENVSSIYKEMREGVKNSSFTSAILLGRKLIMHLAVDVASAPEGETFVKYVEHLKNSGYIPPNGGKALDYIRRLGNEKNHEITIGSKDEAERIIKFIEMLLIFMYEVPNEFPEEEVSN